MTALKERLKRLIAAAGPISVADYMAACLFDPEAGYYTTREPFGAAGDFTTAPEISQMFGELVAIWAYSAWDEAGRPMPMTLAEIGPGRGTLMADMLRTLDRLDTGFVTRARIAMIEASPRLAEIQSARLAGGRCRPTWFSQVSELPALPLVLVGNELFDALPVRQFVRTAQGWRERMVGLAEDGELAFVVGVAGIDPAALPDGADAAPEGAVFEIAPSREALMDEIAARIDNYAEGDPGIEADEATLAEVEQQIEAIQNAGKVYDSDEKALAGCIVTISHGGTVQIERGLVHPDDMAALRRLRQPEAEPDGEDAEARESLALPGADDDTEHPTAYSAALVEELTAIRTAAMRNELVSRPGLALACTLYPLVVKVFLNGPSFWRVGSAVEISGQMKDLAPSIKETEDCAALAEWNRIHESWG